ncbi:HAMP domain-containing sensor histidine kinase [Aestuariivivens sp. NBU2969]|uniref:sensor histidine kinase n=1 Tax=Aestuariivivens sp. NBU2969 TaxID=2873267 RepID=UPI001CBBEC03|nr:HAMP domain-containing sensor histidine kinase [Aestuariivivens sp. NBU2969]
MLFTEYRNTFRWLIIVISFVLVSLILWNTYMFFQNFKQDQRIKMETWTFAYKEIAKDLYNVNKTNKLAEFIIIDSTVTAPMLLVDNNNQIRTFRNLDSLKLLNPIYFEKTKSKLEKENSPIEINIENSESTTLYYGNSPLLNKLKYYPSALILIIVLFGTVIFLFYSSNKNASQNKLWSGMAKETAHQIGTPLSSLIGWTEILKTEQVDPNYIAEIEKDVDRLKTITERFSKIGSVPKLEIADIIEETANSFDYLKARSSNLIDFEMRVPDGYISVFLNKELFSWAIENLVKNAIDAMKGRGKLTIEISQLENNIKVSVTDTGKGILKKDFKKIFEPGYTTKKRGWGLGLSLTRRIIEDFHNGKIKVLYSEIDKGTTIQIVLKRA